MARYIDADKLIEHIKDVPTWYERLGIGWRSTKYPDGMFDCDDVINSIGNQPTADVVEVKHGEWREGALLKVGREIKHYPSVICSDCGITFCDIINNHNYMYRYCPHCGAKMDGGKAE